jgi:hypothetical protein
MKKICLFILTSFTFLFGFFPSEEAEAQPSEERVGFSVRAILPESQRDTGVTYFDLLVEPGETQELQVEIYNHEDTMLEVQVTPTTASTNRNGLIVYESQEEYDESLKHPISELVEIDANTVMVPARGSQIVNIRLEIPEEPFEGYLLGGLHFEKVVNEEEASEQDVQIQNRYAYLIGLQVTEGHLDVEPNLELTGIEPGLVNYRTAVVANIQNNQPIIMGDVAISAEIYEADGEEPIKIATMEDVQFAPNSTMDFVVDWENEPLEEGTYRLDLVATHPDETWEWSEEFTIVEEDETLNDNAVEVKSQTNFTSFFVIILAIFVLVIIILVRYIVKLKRKETK